MQTEREALKAPSPLPLDERGGSDLLLSLSAVWVHLWQYSIYSMGEGASVVSEAAAATSIGRPVLFLQFFRRRSLFCFSGNRKEVGSRNCVSKGLRRRRRREKGKRKPGLL